MNTVTNCVAFAGKLVLVLAATLGLVVGSLMLVELATSARPAEAPLVALANDPGVQAFLHIPASYKTSINQTTDQFVAGWTEEIAEANPLVRQLGALNARQIEFIRSEIAPRMNYICESNPPRYAAEQINEHGDAVFKLVMAAR